MGSSPRQAMPDALTETGFLVKQKIGRGNYYVNLALNQILLNQHDAK
jgi:hypothetical protein